MAVRLLRHWKLAVWWLLSLVLVGAVSSSPQQTRPNQRPGFNPFITETPIVISGNDVGFRIERTQDGIPVGKVVVRVNGVSVDYRRPPRPTTGR